MRLFIPVLLFSPLSGAISSREFCLRHALTPRGNYRAAFLACRKHRLDLNILYDLAPEQFMSSLDEFVKQVPESDYLNLFVSSLK